jgi:hypothetical protein
MRDEDMKGIIFPEGIYLHVCYSVITRLWDIQEDRKIAHIKLKVVIHCIAVNIIISPTARWCSRMHC